MAGPLDVKDGTLQFITAAEAAVGKIDVESNLTHFGFLLMEKFIGSMPQWMMAWANTHGAESCESGDGPPPGMINGQKALAAYLEREMHLGRIRSHDPLVLARTFSGAIWMFAVTEVMFGTRHALTQPREEFVRGLVKALWHGLAPVDSPKSKRTKSTKKRR